PAPPAPAPPVPPAPPAPPPPPFPSPARSPGMPDSPGAPVALSKQAMSPFKLLTVEDEPAHSCTAVVVRTPRAWRALQGIAMSRKKSLVLPKREDAPTERPWVAKG